jgi:hypothetical protein
MRETIVTYRGVDWEVGYDWYASHYGDSRDISIAYIKHDEENILDFLDEDFIDDIRDTIYAQLRREY